MTILMLLAGLVLLLVGGEVLVRGASAIADLLDAEGALSQADSAQVRAVLELRLAQAGLLRAQGDL